MVSRLETNRLLLREIHKEDTETIFNCWMQDEDVSRYMWWKASDDIKEAEKFVDFELSNLENDTWNRWIIVLKETSEIIGTCLIFFNDNEKHWDVSYNLGKKFWGMGYVTEAMSSVMQYAAEVLKVEEIITVHAVQNPASGRVLQKLGFQYEKKVPYECSGGNIITTGKCYIYRVHDKSLISERNTGGVKNE